MKKLLSFLIVLILLPNIAFGAIAFDAKSNNIIGSNNTSGTITISGSNGLATLTLVTTDSAATVTLGGVSMTQLLKQATLDGAYLYLFYLLNPGTGSKTVNITKSDGGSRAQVVSYTGVKQTGFPESSNSGTATLAGAGNSTIALTITNSGCWAIASAENSLVDPDSGIVVTTNRSTEAGIKNGSTQDSGGTISTGTVNVGYHWPGATTVATVAAAFCPAPETIPSFGDFILFE